MATAQPLRRSRASSPCTGEPKFPPHTLSEKARGYFSTCLITVQALTYPIQSCHDRFCTCRRTGGKPSARSSGKFYNNSCQSPPSISRSKKINPIITAASISPIKKPSMSKFFITSSYFVIRFRSSASMHSLRTAATKVGKPFSCRYFSMRRINFSSCTPNVTPFVIRFPPLSDNMSYSSCNYTLILPVCQAF